ncbi:MAG: polyphosphate polymerase domain-containing protein [Clostridiales bacterium]
MAIEVFNRYENKYLLDESTFDKLGQRLSPCLELDPHNRHHAAYTVTNLYYDTADSYLIRTSLQKPKYKEKLRLRSYGVPGENDRIYAEIKKKVAGLTNKRRSQLALADAYSFLATGIMPEEKPYQNVQVLQEIAYIRSRQELIPALYLAYDRRAYFGAGHHDLRISFDCNIRCRRFDLTLEAGDYGQPLLDQGLWLMEIKTAQSIPLWLCRLLSEYKLYPVSFSKYGREYRQSLQKAYPPAAMFHFTAAARGSVVYPQAVNI